MCETFTRRLREVSHEAKDGIATALNNSSGPVLVRSAFELPPGQRTALQQVLNETFSADIQIRFEVAPDLISGIELAANGQKVAWSIADYLVSLEKSISELLKEQPNSEIKGEPETKAETNPAAPEETK